MKKTLIGSAAAMALLVAAPVWATVTVDVDGQAVAFDQPPIMQAGRVLVPLRGVFEKLGATVMYDAGSRNITAQSGATNIKLQIGSTTAAVNGQSQVLDTAPILVGGRALVPLRFVSQALGAAVAWNEGQQLVSITGGGSVGNVPHHQSYTPPPHENEHAPSIAQIQLDNGRLPRDPLSPGQTLTVTMNGTARGRATFDLGGNTGLAMKEGPSGTYTGQYTVRQSDPGHKAVVAVHLTGSNGQAISQTADQPIAFSESAPKSDHGQRLIRSVLHNASGTLAVGKILQVTMVGEPGGTATLDVGGHTAIPMREVSHGTYVGNFTVPAGEVSPKAQVVAHLTMPNGATMSLVAPTSVSFLPR